MTEKNRSDNPIVVSISCITYNHAPFIRQCLDGFMMQQTDFAFEVLIHDDASTDGTTEIIKEYEAKYPDVFKPIYEEENQWVKGRRGSAVFNFPRAKGKYIALCEGDDYWTDPLKLQKQVDFLNAHNNFTMCFTNAIQHYEDGHQEDTKFAEILDREYSGVELFVNWIVPTATLVVRSEVVRSNLYIKATQNPYFIFGDILVILAAATHGKVWGFSNPTCVYRRLSTGALATTDRTYSGKLAYIRHVIEIQRFFGDEYNCESMVLYQYYALMRRAWAENEICKLLRFVCSSLRYSFVGTLRLYMKKMIMHLKRYRLN